MINERHMWHQRTLKCIGEVRSNKQKLKKLGPGLAFYNNKNSKHKMRLFRLCTYKSHKAVEMHKIMNM